jgi:hypothetical protein
VLFVIINANNLVLSKEQKSTGIHLQAPHLSDRSQSYRPPFEALTNATRSRKKPKKISAKDSINPCNGTYQKTNGTTCGLKEIMIGRCYEFEYVKRGFSLTNES